ncbi:6-phospho-beta-galactosidase [Staphylococcus massiliensis]|uniref:beta-glucosidase n=1 Tax=Staphylococcus massiliensis S46 TaxID=1229783 RepID=K9AKF9_9STAP|nr:6-phospho-beta-galactosidase [Staphylococcus massiliensis]EKU47769.1 6-phospho-beta-galactosidase [Staphylococcus massiliensis S46]POA01629.1 6-phospho-beta-galactosidase [Staphylococcus massiliensis CCUG 55927]
MIKLPKEFILGAATAAYQVEGASKEDNKGRVLWDEFLEKQGRFSPDPASDFYHRYEEDIKLASKYGIKALRISIAWSRIFPSGTGEINQLGVNYYRNVFETCHKYGIEPFVTLHHFDTPETLFKKGDWLNKDQIETFKNYAAFVFDTYHDVVKNWITINEPIAYVQGQYISGAFPPGEKYQKLKALQAQHNQMVAHSKIVNLFKSRGYEGEIGLVHALLQFYSIDDKEDNHLATYRHDTFMNGYMLDATFLGTYSKEKLNVIQAILGDEYQDLIMTDAEMEEIKQAAQDLDFLGINYYQSNWIKHHDEESLIHHNGTGDKGTSIFRLKGIGEVVKNEAIPTTDWDWYIYPQGLYDMMQRIKEDYPNYKKIYVTENGLGYKDEFNAETNEIDDQPRIDYIKQHIEAISDAYRDGINVKGYFVWSLQDMFSWSNGYNKRYGLFYIDFETQKRYVKHSAKWYKALSDDIYES